MSAPTASAGAKPAVASPPTPAPNVANATLEALITPVDPNSDPISAIPYDANSYSPQLSKLIADIIKSNDPLDQPTFDRIAYINTLFPDVLSLMSLDPAVAKLKAKVGKLDEELVKEVRKQSNVGVQGKKDLEDAKKSINELFGKVKDIKDKAEKSEQMVMEITRDIKSLDHAKKYLTTSIKYLKNLKMQISDVEQLKVVVAKRKYREIGNLLEIVLERQQSFTAHSNIAKIRLLGGVIEKLKADLTKIIYEEFEKFDAQEPGRPVSPHLSDVCFVVDALGHNLKDEFITKFVDGQLQDYRNSFSDNRELEALKQRFYWLQCELDYFDKNYSTIFPHSWRMAELISEEFCIATKLAVSDLLEKTKRTLDVKALVKSIELTIDFERALSDRFKSGMSSADTYMDPEDDEKGEEEEFDSGVAKYYPENIKKRYQHHKEKKEEQKQLQQMQQAQAAVGEETRAATNFKGIISRSFDPYMDLYIATEDRNMKEMLEHLIAEETWTVPEELNKNKVLGSSTDLIFYFNEARKRCSKLTRGQPFFDLFGLFKKYLFQYAQILSSKLPPEGMRTQSEEEDKRLCIILNTAEYCLATIAQMKDIIARLIDDQFKEQIDLKSEEDEYGNLVSKGLKALVNSLEGKLEPAVTTMRSLPWGDEEAVGEESPYVNEIDSILAQEIPIYRGLLGTAHFKYFCDLFVGQFIPRIIQTIYKLKKISETGAQRLLLDITTLRKVFVMMPTFGMTDGTSAPARFIKLVDKEITKATVLLRVLQVPSTMPEKLIELYRLSIPDGTSADFARVLDLKGFRFKEKDDILAKFQNTAVGGARAPSDALKRLIANVF